MLSSTFTSVKHRLISHEVYQDGKLVVKGSGRTMACKLAHALGLLQSGNCAKQ